MSLTLEHRSKWSVLTLKRPPRNELDRETLCAILAALDELEAGKSPPLLLRAEGMHFSTGYPIAEIPEAIFHRDPEVRAADPFEMVMHRISGYAAPVLAAIQGDAYGGAVELLACTDLRLAATTARFGVPPVRLGLVYSHTGLRRLLRGFGSAMTRELLLTGEAITAETALHAGFLNRVVPATELAENTDDLLASIARGQTSALRGTRRVLNLLEENESLSAEALREIADLRHASHNSDEFRAAQRAFLSKSRDPE